MTGIEQKKSFTIEIASIGKISGVGRIRHLAKSLAESLEEYDEQVQHHLREEIKYLHLCLKDAFGTSEHDSKEAWQNYLKQIEDSLTKRVETMNQAVIETAAEIKTEE